MNYFNTRSHSQISDFFFLLSFSGTLKFNFHFINWLLRRKINNKKKKSHTNRFFIVITWVGFINLNTSLSLPFFASGHRLAGEEKAIKIPAMSPSKLPFHDGHIMSHQAPILNLSSYTSSLTSSSSPASGMSHDSDGRSSSSSPSNLNSSIFSGFGHACSHCTSSFLTRELLEKHEMMHISNATMVSSFFILLIFNSLFFMNLYVWKKRRGQDASFN